MHVLPLPFGMALAVLPRREAAVFCKPKAPIRVVRGPATQERLLAHLRYTDVRQHIL